MTLQQDPETDPNQSQAKAATQVEELDESKQQQPPELPFQYQSALPPQHYLFEGLPPAPPIQPQQPLYLQASKKRDWLPVKWRRLHPTYKTQGVDVEPRQGHRAVAYKHLMITFSGGNEELFNDLNVYNTVTNEWFQPNVKGQVPPPRAAYGAAIDGHRILIFGGMEEGVTFVDTLYELNVQKWEWTLLSPSCFGRTRFEKPCARIGHSFTLIKDRVFMFGGLSMEKELTEDCGYFPMPNYLNELHVLHARLNKQHGVWEKPDTFGTLPCRRESHTAVAYSSKDLSHHKLVIFGGMLGYRLGDLFTLDVDTMLWTEIRSKNLIPRSLHSATLIGEKIYIFGGWVPVQTPEEERMGIVRCDVSDMLCCFNVRTSSWEPVRHTGTGFETATPRARAGHSAVAINNRVYVWSGRYGYKRMDDGKQICLDDLWMLDVDKPGTPGKVYLLAAGHESLIVGWAPVLGADGYVLQCMEFKQVDEGKSLSNAVKPPSVPPPPTTLTVGAPQTQIQWRNLMTVPSRATLPGPRLFQAPNGQLPPPNRMMMNRFFGPAQLPSASQLANPRQGLLAPRGSLSQPMQLLGVGGAPPMHPQILRRPPTLPIIPTTVTASNGHPPSVAPQFNFGAMRPQMTMTRKEVTEVVRAFMATQQQPCGPGPLQVKQLGQVPRQVQDVRTVLQTTKSTDQINGNSSTATAVPTSTLSKPMPSGAPTLQLVTPDMQPQIIPQQFPRQMLRLVQLPNSTPQRPTGNYVRILTPGQSQVTQQAPPRLTLTGHGIPGSVSSAAAPQPPPHQQQ